jgi:aspartyl-tRNA(Asn)/glutamyl-tRNA(Gln) amidotransferase subunit A
MQSLADIADDLATGRTSSQALTEAALARIEDPAGEGARAFIKVYRDAALDSAKASDQARRHGIVSSPLAGIPVSIKDLCDVAGETTLAGSIVHKDAEPAGTDAPTVARLRAAGAVIMGRTNMVEFAMARRVPMPTTARRRTPGIGPPAGYRGARPRARRSR